MKKKKIVIVSLIVVALVCFSCGLGGLYLSKTKIKVASSEYKVNILYYLDEQQELKSIPKNKDGETLYRYDRYVCSNKVTGKWDNDKWEFIPNKTADSNCKVYFVSAMHKVNLNIANGEIEPGTKTLIDKGKDATFKIIPLEGHTFESATCQNSEEIFWNEETSELTIKTIQQDTACDIKYKLNDIEIEIVVSNGKGDTKKTAPYKTALTSEVTPSDGYGSPTITCTNDQVATWENNILKVESLAKNTKCTVNFKSINTPISYTVTLNISGNATYKGPESINSGGTVYFDLTISPGYRIGSIPDNCGTWNDHLVTIANVVKNTTCNINIVSE